MIYTQRVFWKQFNTTAKHKRILEFLGKRRSICDAISFFTESDGNDFRYVPIEEVERRAAYLHDVVRDTRAAGFVPVINILNTLGHSDDVGPDTPLVPWQPMVDFSGIAARQCSCPADSDFIAYITNKYRLYGRCGADRYWIDDDARAVHAPAPLEKQSAMRLTSGW